jgi:hypothetical protein
MSVQIVETMGRATQGVTKPYICRARDAQVYFVKGLGAGRESLIREWLAGQLGLRLGLPIAPIEIVDIPDALICADFTDELRELGPGLAFGSSKVDVAELTVSHLWLVSQKIQREVLLFDYWIHNADRSLTEFGGNPNLFWDNCKQELVVIDHNQAFDQDFDLMQFLETHVFRDQWRIMMADELFRQSTTQKLEQAMLDWPSICETIPAEWWFIDSEQTMRCGFDLMLAHQLLMRFKLNAFWSAR